MTTTELETYLTAARAAMREQFKDTPNAQFEGIWQTLENKLIDKYLAARGIGPQTKQGENPMWTIAKVNLHDPQDDYVMYAISPSDGETAYLVGELPELLELSAALRDFVDAGGTTPHTIDELDACFGHAWLSTGDAAREYHVPPSTMRSWMEASPRAEKRGNSWHAPEIVIRGWVARWTPHGAK